MHRIVVNVQTGEVTQVELTAEEIAALHAEQVSEVTAIDAKQAPEATAVEGGTE